MAYTRSCKFCVTASDSLIDKKVMDKRVSVRVYGVIVKVRGAEHLYLGVNILSIFYKVQSGQTSIDKLSMTL